MCQSKSCFPHSHALCFGGLPPCVQQVRPALSCTGSDSAVITDGAVPYSQLGNHQPCCRCVDFHALVSQTAFGGRRFPLCSRLGAGAAARSLLPMLRGAVLGDASARRTPACPGTAALIGEAGGTRLHFKTVGIAPVRACACWEGVLAAQEAAVRASACSSDPGAVTWMEMKETTMENTVIDLLPCDSS